MARVLPGFFGLLAFLHSHQDARPALVGLDVFPRIASWAIVSDGDIQNGVVCRQGFVQRRSLSETFGCRKSFQGLGVAQADQ